VKLLYTHTVIYTIQLENVAMRRIVTEGRPALFLGPRDTSDLISMVAFTFAMLHHLIRLASAPFTSFRLTKFGWVPFADLRVQRLATKQNTEFTEGVRKLRFYFKSFMTKVHEILEQCTDPSYLQTPLPDCLRHVSFRRYLLLSLKVVKKPNKCKRFLAPIFYFFGGGRETTPTFL